MKRRTVFISHNKADREAARTIALFLVAENVDVWFDEWKISAGDSILGEIENGLDRCTHFFILWSKNGSKSNWVRKELTAALKQAIERKKPRIVPILLDNQKLPPLLSDIRGIQYNNGTEEDRVEIIQTVAKKKPSVDLIKAIVKKYNELIFDDSNPYPFPYKACPSCGSQNFKYSQFIDQAGDDMYFIIKCLDCSWSEWTQ